MTIETTLAELPVSELHNILANTIFFAVQDSSIPSLNSVRLNAHGGDLKASATDRYQIGTALAEADFVDPDMCAVIPLDTAKVLIKALKGYKRNIASSLTVTIVEVKTDDKVELRFEMPLPASTEDDAEPATHIYSTLIEEQYPRVDSLFDTTFDPCKEFCILPKYLANVAKIKRVDGTDSRESTMLIGGVNNRKAVTIRRGDWFTGLIMPVKIQPLSSLHSLRFDVPAALSERAQELVKLRENNQAA